MTLLNTSLSQYTTVLYETARSLLQSRNTQAARAEKFQHDNQQLRTRLNEQQQRLDQAEQQLTQARAEIQSLHQQQRQMRDQPPRLWDEMPLPSHQYGPKFIALCLNLVQRIGFRPTVSALEIFLDALAVKQKIPTAETIRTWACRAGIAKLKQPTEQADDWIWMVDHSNQVGREKVLHILGIRAADLPPPGQTLARQKLRSLAVLPGTDWKRDDMREVYRQLQKQHGTPRYLLSDAAVELQESADVLQKDGKSTIVLGDFKHFAANALERVLKQNDRFESYLAHVGRSRCQVQQTELGHFAAAKMKTKARFMNLGPVLRWGQMVSYHASKANSRSRQGITAARFNQKLGWIRKYRGDLVIWNRCQQVVQTSLRLINREGLCHGTSEKLREALEQNRVAQGRCEASDSLMETLIAFVLNSESKLATGDRAWLSTETLESSFGGFKQLEGQQSKGGFTSLIAAMPMLLQPWCAASVRESFRLVSTKQMRSWVEKNLGQTLTAKQRIAYQESSQHLRVA